MEKQQKLSLNYHQIPSSVLLHQVHNTFDIRVYVYLHYQGVSTLKYDLTLEYENDVKLPYILFGGEKKTKGKQTDFQRVISEKHM